MEQGQIGKRDVARRHGRPVQKFPGRPLELRGHPEPRRMIATPPRESGVEHRTRLTVCLHQILLFGGLCPNTSSPEARALSVLTSRKHWLDRITPLPSSTTFQQANPPTLKPSRRRSALSRPTSLKPKTWRRFLAEPTT